MMTNRLLGIVVALALTSGVGAHAAQAPQRPLTPISLPAALQTAASRVSETATAAVDPSAAIRAAYQRDHVALEHLRQQASPLKGAAHSAFNQFISDQEAALTQIERTALATSRPDASSTIAAMDTLVIAAEDKLNRELSGTGTAGTKDSERGAESPSNNKPGESGAAHASDG